MQSVFQLAAVIAIVSTLGCGTSTNNGLEVKSAAELKVELFATAEQMEGGLAQAVKSWVNNAERGVSWHIVDEQIAPGKFTPETIAAYQKWRAAKIAEDRTIQE